MEVSSDQECFEDNKVIVDIPPGEGEINNESENREVGADMDKNLQSDQNPSNNESENIEQLREVGNLNYWKFLRDVRLLEKVNAYKNASSRWEELLQNENFKHKTTPLGNTLLHIAVESGNEHFVDEVVRQAPRLLTAKSANGDTALHVAAKAGHFYALKRLISAHFQNSENLQEALKKILEQNNNGNNFFHEALINGHQGVMKFLVSDTDDNLKEAAKEAAMSVRSYLDKSGVYLAIEAGYKDVVDQAFTDVIPNDPKYVPQGKSLLLAAIIKQDDDILDTVLTRKPEWIHVRDDQGRVPLHYAASIGYLKGVQSLLAKCASCVLERDICGYFPIHLASYADHVTIVQELLKSDYCPDPRDILDNDGRNILHIAVESGKLSVVKYILQASNNHGLEKIINEQDRNGNTPLHLATLFCHPKIMFALTWDKRVDVNLVNRKGETALNVLEFSKRPTLRQRLTWVALVSAGARYAEPKSSAIKVPRGRESISVETDMDKMKDRIGTLMLVSTLILTVSFASGFTMPGGTNSSGEAVMLHHIWFKLFIFCITISMYGAITVILILIPAQAGDVKLALFSIRVANSLLGITLSTLSLAFLAAVHLVVKNLSWLATASLVMCFYFILILLFLLMLVFWLPSSSRNPVLRYTFYYPFLLLAILVNYYEDSLRIKVNMNASKEKAPDANLSKPSTLEVQRHTPTNSISTATSVTGSPTTIDQISESESLRN